MQIVTRLFAALYASIAHELNQPILNALLPGPLWSPSLQKQLGAAGRNLRCAELVVTLAVGNAQGGLGRQLLLETNLPGFFCVGDVRYNSIKRVSSSVGEGSMAIAFVHQ